MDRLCGATPLFSAAGCMGLRKFSIEEAHHEHPRTADTQHDAQWQRTEGSIRGNGGCNCLFVEGLPWIARMGKPKRANCFKARDHDWDSKASRLSAVPQLPPAGASLARDAAKPASRNSGKPGADRTGAEILGATSPYRRSLATRWMRWACSCRQSAWICGLPRLDVHRCP